MYDVLRYAKQQRTVRACCSLIQSLLSSSDDCDQRPRRLPRLRLPSLLPLFLLDDFVIPTLPLEKISEFARRAVGMEQDDILSQASLLHVSNDIDCVWLNRAGDCSYSSSEPLHYVVN